jgi:23S rRNA (cytidine2498-2'-O)-methyltransferase
MLCHRCRGKLRYSAAMSKTDQQTSAQAAAITPTSGASSITLLGYCRAGFENDVIVEWMSLAQAKCQVVSADSGSGFAIARFPNTSSRGVANVLRMPSIFSRAIVTVQADVLALGTRDRVTPIVAAAIEFLQRQSIASIADVWVEYPDTNDGKTLSKLSTALETRIFEALGEQGHIRESSPHRLHVFLTGKEVARIGVSDSRAASSSNWRHGIPRLRVPKDAPSRSTAKLAEAIYYFLGDNEERVLQPEMRAADLGAAPGGWTWQLVHRGLHVTAVDNGPMKGEMLDNALVRHLREDAFRFRPPKAFDWMVCDIVDSPSRIAALVGKWLAEGWARHSIFNLKLPMKKRYEEVERCRAIIEEVLGDRRSRFDLQFKHMYHDREEITAYAGLIARPHTRR